MLRTSLTAGVLLMAGSLAVYGWGIFSQTPESAEIFLRHGTELLDAGASEQAARELQLVLGSSREDLRRAAHHNLALACLKLSMTGSGPGAVDWARKAVSQAEAALRLDPEFRDAAWNLELALKRLRELTEGEEMAKAEQAEHFLDSFRLEEESRLADDLQQRLTDAGSMSRPRRGGLPWW